ncbi:hypothetical protein TTRE_0000180201 [Trichuris trichiura]|uniref:Uncharacterized protein n=1 Tax=Trichuris trichiura TaxID=36087 RepID=A0A077YZK1_TRITR|nr:hypothetical protein TTRE_0000180201 [Trichuris trichiura]
MITMRKRKFNQQWTIVVVQVLKILDWPHVCLYKSQLGGNSSSFPPREADEQVIPRADRKTTAIERRVPSSAAGGCQPSYDHYGGDEPAAITLTDSKELGRTSAYIVEQKNKFDTQPRS